MVPVDHITIADFTNLVVLGSISRPVSYTHLDVYKRQHLHYINSVVSTEQYFNLRCHRNVPDGRTIRRWVHFAMFMLQSCVPQKKCVQRHATALTISD